MYSLKSGFNFFDFSVLINLEERTDRLAESINEFKKYNIKINNFYVFPGMRFEQNHPMSGRAGCFSSHRKIVEFAKVNKLENILVFEDDFQFTENPSKLIKTCSEFLSKNDWDLFYLGQTTTPELCDPPLIHTSTNGILQLKGGLATHAIAYNHTVFDYLLQEIPEPDLIIPWLMENESMDGWIMRNIQNNDKYKCFTCDPMLCTQRDSYSNVDNKFVNYSTNLINNFKNERLKI